MAKHVYIYVTRTPVDEANLLRTCQPRSPPGLKESDSSHQRECRRRRRTREVEGRGRGRAMGLNFSAASVCASSSRYIPASPSRGGLPRCCSIASSAGAAVDASSNIKKKSKTTRPCGLPRQPPDPRRSCAIYIYFCIYVIGTPVLGCPFSNSHFCSEAEPPREPGRAQE